MHSHGLYKHSVVRSCHLFFKIYIFTAHIVKHKLLEAMRMILEAVRVFVRKVEALRVFWRSRVFLKVIRVLVHTVRVLVL